MRPPSCFLSLLTFDDPLVDFIHDALGTQVDGLEVLPLHHDADLRLRTGDAHQHTAQDVYKRQVPTPAVAYLVRKYNADAGVVISASHNPMEFNGIKIFAGTGYKLPDEVENEIEAYIDNQCAGLKLATGEDVGRVTCRTDGIKDYTCLLYTSIS